jgi:hypothetical protein
MLLTGRDPLADGANDPAKEWVRSALRRHARRFVDTRRLIETGIAHQRGEVPFDMTGRPGGPEQAELVWLSYPPSPNTRWIQRLAPFRIESVIEAHESLELPAGRFPAYRVRIENSLLDEDDTVTVWFGRCGRLAYRVHQESVALDVDTGEMVRITSDEAEFLTSIDLVEPGRCSGSRD